MKRSYIIIASAISLAVFFTVAGYLYNTQQAQTMNQAANQNADALIAAHSPRKGNPQAKVTIVEFLDPACGTCKQFHPVIKDLLAKYPEKINVVLRYAPFHHGSEQMVAILEAARKQDQFWNVLDLMFETQQYWAINHQARADLFWGYLKGYGFDIERLQQDMQDPAIAKVIEQDLADGKLLGANKTPTFFVNGKPLPSFGYEQLMTLINSELSAND